MEIWRSKTVLRINNNGFGMIDEGGGLSVGLSQWDEMIGVRVSRMLGSDEIRTGRKFEIKGPLRVGDKGVKRLMEKRLKFVYSLGRSERS